MRQLNLNEYVVYPNHGIGVVEQIQMKKFNGRTYKMYMLKMINSGMKILVPASKLKEYGVRKPVSKTAANRVLCSLVVPLKIKRLSWSKQYVQLQNLLSSGSLTDVAKVFRVLQTRSETTELSFGERKILHFVADQLNAEFKLVLQGEF